MKWFLLLVSLSVWADDLPDRAEIAAIFSELGRTTGMPPKREVKVNRMTREELEKYLESRIRKTSRRSEIRAEELALKWLGLAPPDFDLAASTVDLLTEQAAAFYDYKTKKLVLLENPIGEFDRFVLAHELAHALADQHYKIGRFMDDAAMTDDSAMARMAVVEGQASWLMTEFQLKESGQEGLLENPSLLPKWNSLDPANSYAYPVLEKAPLYLKVSLLFPYWEGGRFQQEVLKRKGTAGFRAVFEDPPSTTQQILHPEIYFEKRAADIPEFPKKNPKGWKTLAKGTLGELDHLIFYRIAGLTDGAELAREWRGATYHVLESKTKCCRVEYRSRWASDEIAERAMDAWTKYSAAKALRGRLTMHREGRDVVSVEEP